MTRYRPLWTSSQMCADPTGAYVLYDDAQREIQSRDVQIGILRGAMPDVAVLIDLQTLLEQEGLNEAAIVIGAMRKKIEEAIR